MAKERIRDAFDPSHVEVLNLMRQALQLSFEKRNVQNGLEVENSAGDKL